MKQKTTDQRLEATKKLIEKSQIKFTMELADFINKYNSIWNLDETKEKIDKCQVELNAKTDSYLFVHHWHFNER